MTPEVETPPEPEAETTEPQPLHEATSLSEHREAFPPPAKRGAIPPTEAELPRERHRPKSQTAGVEDVKQIEAYTKRFREAEDDFIQKSGLKIEQKAGESERAFNLRKRAELAEARRDAAAAPVVSIPPTRPAAATVSTFAEKEPTLDQFHDQPDPYGAHVRALAAYDARKAAFDAQQTTEQDRSVTERNAWVQKIQTESSARLLAHLNANPADKALYEAETKKPEGEQLSLTPVMRVAIETHGQGPSFVVELLKHPEFADELLLATNGQYAFDGEGRMNPAVATLQRRLLARVQAVKTGAAAPARPVVVAPRPPTPVRASATNAVESSRTPDPESRSLAEHREKFGRR